MGTMKLKLALHTTELSLRAIALVKALSTLLTTTTRNLVQRTEIIAWNHNGLSIGELKSIPPATGQVLDRGENR